MKPARIKRRLRRFWNKTSRFRNAATFSILVAILHIVLFAKYAETNIEPKVMDYWFSIRGAVEPPKDILVVAVDEKSHEELGASTLEPWPRLLTAKFLERIAEFKPKAVILDFSYRQNKDPEIDARFANSLSLSTTYIAMVIQKHKRRSLSGEMEPVRNELKPNPRFLEKSAGMFYANLRGDKVLRKFISTKKLPDNVTTLYDISREGRKLESSNFPTANDFINFYGPPASLPGMSFHEVLSASDETLREAITGRYVFLGQQLFMAYKTQQMDTFITPFQQATAGVEVHATVLGNLLNNSWIRSLRRDADDEKDIHLHHFIIFVLSGLLTFVICSNPPIHGLFVLFGSWLAWGVSSYFVFARMNYFLPGAVLVLGVLPLVFTLSSIRYHYRTKALEKAMGLTEN